MGPVLASDLNALWAAERLPYRLDRRGVANLWAVCPAGTDTHPPLLFIVGNERRAVSQAHQWASRTSGITAAADTGETFGTA